MAIIKSGIIIQICNVFVYAIRLVVLDYYDYKNPTSTSLQRRAALATVCQKSNLIQYYKVDLNFDSAIARFRYQKSVSNFLVLSSKSKLFSRK